MRILCVYVDVADARLQLDTIVAYMEKFNAGTRAGEHLWFVKTGKKPTEICDEIAQLSLPEKYDVLIFEVGEKWATHSARDEVKSWMGKHI